MRLFNQLSIKTKLMAIITIPTSVALLAGFTLSVVHDVRAFKAEMVEKVMQGAQITGDFLVTDLAFGDKVRVGALARLNALADVTYACVYDRDHHLIREMGTLGSEIGLSRPQVAGHRFEGNLLSVDHPLDFQGTKYGTLYIQASTERLDEKLAHHIATMFFILLGIVGLSAFAAFKLQALISSPILALAATASAISKKADYTIRLTRTSDDEIGVLFDGFNGMLEKIERRDKALRKSAAQYRTLFEQATDAIFISDSEGNYVDVNPSACKMVGYSRDELLKRSLSSLIPDKDLQAEPIQLDDLKAGKVVARERRLQRKDNRIIIVELSAKMLDDGRIQVFARDITERRLAESQKEAAFEALRESEFRLRQMTDTIGDVFWITEWGSKKTIFASKSYEKIWGRTLKSLYADPKGWADAIHPEEKDRAWENFVRLGEGEAYDEEYRIIRPKGEVRWIRDRGYPLRGAQGGVSRVIGVAQDITERKQAEEQLRESEARYRMLVENSPYCIHQIDERGCLTSMNRAGLDMMGISTESEIQGMPYLDAVGENDKHKVQALLQEAYKGNSSEFEFEAVNSSIFQSSFVPLADESGHITRLMGLTSNITKRKRAEQRIARFSRIFEDSLNEIYLFEADSLKFTQVNSAAQNNLGYTMEELQKLTPLALKPEFTTESFAKLVAPLREGVKEKIVFETVHKRKDQSIYDVEVHLQLLKHEHETLFAAIILDITERKRAEEALHESELRYRSLFENSPIAIWEEDFSEVKEFIDNLNGVRDGDFEAYLVAHPDIVQACARRVKIVDVNQAALRLHNVADKAELLSGLENTFTDASFESFRKELVAIVKGETAIQSEGAIKTLDGRERDIELRWSVAPGFERSLARVLVTIEDITDRKQVQEVLRKSEEKYKSLFENMQSGSALHEMVFDEAGTPIDYIFLDVNDAFEKQTTLKRENLIGRKVTEALPGIENDPADWIGTYGKVVLTGNSLSFENYAEALKKWYSVVAYRPNEGQFAVVFLDITERKQAEEKIKAALAEKEVMLKEIHHRVKNNLQVISSLLNLQARHIKDKEALAIFTDSRNRVRSMALIHEKLYQTKDFSQVDFADYARDLSAQLFRAYNIDADKIKFDLDVGDVHLAIDVAVPCGLIMNELLSNCLSHAFPGGGKGTVRLKLHSKRPTKKKPGNRNPVVLTVSDDGVGLPAGFDISKTSSLGMQLVKTLSAQIDAVLQIKSGKGAHFTITFETEATEKLDVSAIEN